MAKASLLVLLLLLAGCSNVSFTFTPSDACSGGREAMPDCQILRYQRAP